MRLTIVSSAALALAAACGSSNPAPETAPRSEGARSRAQLDSMRRNRVIENDRTALSARAGMLVVANQKAASASVIDAASMRTIATVPVGVGPHEVAISPDGRWAVVTNYGDRTVQGNTLSVIDLAAAVPAMVRTIDLGEYHRPHGAAFIGSGDRLVVTSEASQRLVLVDFTTGTVDTTLATNGRGSHMVAVTRDGRRGWTANISDGSVTEYDLDARRTVRTYPAATMDEGIAATPDGAQVWVGSNDKHTVTVLDATKGTAVATLTGFGSSYRIGISRSGFVAVVNDPLGNRIWLYDVRSRKRIAEIDLAKAEGVKPSSGGAPGHQGAGPEGVTFDPIVGFAYVTLNGTNQVAAVDLGQRKVVGVGSTGDGPDGIAFSPLVPKR